MNRQEPYVGMPLNLMDLEDTGRQTNSVREQNHSMHNHNDKDCSPQPNMQPMELAMAYVPWQCWVETYDLEKALDVGTIFPNLDLPFLGYKGGNR